MQPFRVSVSDEEIAFLKERLASTRCGACLDEVM